MNPAAAVDHDGRRPDSRSPPTNGPSSRRTACLTARPAPARPAPATCAAGTSTRRWCCGCRPIRRGRATARRSCATCERLQGLLRQDDRVGGGQENLPRQPDAPGDDRRREAHLLMTRHPSRDLLAALAIVALAAAPPQRVRSRLHHRMSPSGPGVGRRRGARGHQSEFLLRSTRGGRRAVPVDRPAAHLRPDRRAAERLATPPVHRPGVFRLRGPAPRPDARARRGTARHRRGP